MGKFVVLLILLSALIGGAGLWYSLTRAYWSEIEGPVTLTLAHEDDLTTLPAEAVRYRIKMLIDGEQIDNVLSDDQIVDTLREFGVDIARLDRAAARQFR